MRNAEESELATREPETPCEETLNAIRESLS